MQNSGYTSMFTRSCSKCPNLLSMLDDIECSTCLQATRAAHFNAEAKLAKTLPYYFLHPVAVPARAPAFHPYRLSNVPSVNARALNASRVNSSSRGGMVNGRGGPVGTQVTWPFHAAAQRAAPQGLGLECPLVMGPQTAGSGANVVSAPSTPSLLSGSISPHAFLRNILDVALLPARWMPIILGIGMTEANVRAIAQFPADRRNAILAQAIPSMSVMDRALLGDAIGRVEPSEN
ncbi:hypothetical protein C8F04DRAFT_1240324 [Mycena alexandri]|uniref:Uncharacterized protein n=1 Tax=Mycena alexandri TaxID=1745969 RepID=A0AAD6S933_9AGAR|nr:hypothetical protein C8F04DRAFT_1240324 [Mycena alexandri]